MIAYIHTSKVETASLSCPFLFRGYLTARGVNKHASLFHVTRACYRKDKQTAGVAEVTYDAKCHLRSSDFVGQLDSIIPEMSSIAACSLHRVLIVCKQQYRLAHTRVATATAAPA